MPPSSSPTTTTTTPERQPVHSDADFAHPSHPFALVVNIPLVTMTPENGSTELWLGTHSLPAGAQEGRHGERASGRIRRDLLELRRRDRGPCQPVVRKGGVVVRDLRLWHAGMPNWGIVGGGGGGGGGGDGDGVRVMLAMIHFAPWYRNRMRLRLGEDVRPVLEGLEREGRLGGLDVSAVDWLSREEVLGPGGYMNVGFGNSFDFDQEP
ncbi:hypothetical protein VPNG_05673 [Cytospora leucostoma]|uniref:Kanamycin B dioxygenase n=1 Tax=Cytospora leucostoma TaxID=1230097 RepID=A0A423X0I5_9PEZI|nr:hypothetical protein VPNG_05673 [Cytospora leucostoma]